MVPDMTAPVSRFHQVLVDEIKKQRPDYLRRPFTVAEIYQILVPYRSHRDTLGVEMNGDYEDALLRLLAGAGDLVHLESDDARNRILKELQSKNPNTGLFREFAASEVRLNSEQLPEDALAEVKAMSEPTAVAEGAVNGEAKASAQDAPEVSAVQAAPVAESQPAEDEPAPLVLDETEATEDADEAPTYFDFETSTIAAVEQSAMGAVTEPTGSAPEPATMPSADLATDEPGGGIWKPGELPVSTSTQADLTDCLWCDEQLPDRDVVNFCPHCGTSTKVKPCASCGTEMDMGWRYCISCGSESKGPLAKAS